MTDQPISAPVGRGRWRIRPLWVGGAVVAVVLPLVVARVGTQKLILSPETLSEQRSHGTWRHMFDLNGVAAAIPLPLWAFALVAAGVIGFPYAWLVARALPDRGYGLSRVIGLLLMTWVVWWISSLRLLPFTRAAIAAAIVVVTAGSVAITILHRDELATWVRANWRLVLVEEGVFWLFFAAALYVRWSNPDLWHATRGGEKPMDFAYFNAVTKSSFFPPFDPWFAGGQMNYYYYGFVQVAALAKITAIPPALAYNLAIPTLVGLLASTSFCAGLGLGSVAKRARRAPYVVAALATLFVTAFGNLGEIRVLRSWLHQDIPIEWWFWNPTRVIHPGVGEPGPITEFPAFTYIYGDLHAHAMALPLAALALALTIAIVRDPGGLRVLSPTLGLLALTLGALWVTNTWDFPTYGFIAVCGAAIAAVRSPRSLRALATLVAVAVGLIALAYLAYLPFHLHYEAVFEGFQRWEGRRTRFFDYLTVHGLFLFVIVSALVVQLASARDLGSVARTYRLGLRSWQRIGRFRELRGALVRGGPLHRAGLAAVAASLMLVVVCGAAGLWPEAAALTIATLAVLAWPVRARVGVDVRDQALRRLVIVFVVVGLALTIAVEFYVLRNIDIGRTNTVFKLYLQVWLLFALAAAVSVATVYDRMPSLRRSLRESWRLAFVLLLAVAALYPLLAAHAKIGDRFDSSVGRTLDGTAFMKKAVFSDKAVAMPLAYDRDAIRWMQEHVDGSPVVAEVNTAPTLYGWEARYAMFTGNPTIVGWDYHQRQQRPSQSELVRDRVNAVQKLYRTKDAAIAYRILNRFDASYVVVGPLERAYFPQGTAKWAAGEGRYWTLVYENPGVQIYRVESADATAAASSSGDS